MSLSLSRPLLALLLAVVVISVVTSLRPAAVSAEVHAAAEELLPPPKGQSRTLDGDAGNWSRKPYSLKPEYEQKAAPVSMSPVVVSEIPENLVPTVPESGFSYIGRMVRDGKVYAFVGRGDEVDVVTAGDELGQDWRLDVIESQSLTVRYLPLNETRTVAMSRDK